MTFFWHASCLLLWCLQPQERRPAPFEISSLIDEGLIDGHDPADTYGYVFTFYNGPNNRYTWWGRADPDLAPGQSDYRHFYLDETGDYTSFPIATPRPGRVG